MARVRVRQHVNPLSQKYSHSIQCPKWEHVYGNASQPLHLDIGCARGKFLLNLAPLQPDWNFLGVEIRESLAIEANENGDRLGLSNLHFLFGNVNSSPLEFLQQVPQPLQRVSIQFPDPWFKQRHSKRRVLQPDLVQAIAQVLMPGGEVFVQSDVELVAREMGDRLNENPHFTACHGGEWLADSIFPVPTEREIACATLQRPVYRLLFERNQDKTEEGGVSSTLPA